MSLRPPGPDGDNLDLTIRFSASLPDLLLTIPLTPIQSLPNTSTLKQQIRTRLSSEYANRRIRLIYAGKALADDAPLSTSLKRSVSRPPSRVSTPVQGPYDDSDTPSAKLKGKAPLRDNVTVQRIYIHCSIGDVVLSAAELASEASLARPRAESAEDAGKFQDGSAEVSRVDNRTQSLPQPEGPAPRGFDRLLTSGFSPSEVQSLRLQFLAIQAHTHTPDTMPDPSALRDLEDRWLDNSNSTPGDLAGSPGVEGGGFGGDDGQSGALDDMIFGTAMGFFWPVGCLMWAVREEGIWSQRRKMAVVVGVLLNVGLGVMRYTG